MKLKLDWEQFTTRSFLRLSILAFTAIVSFYLGKHWSDDSSPLTFFSTTQSSASTSHSIALSPNANFSSDISSILPQNATSAPPPLPRKVGIVDELGSMQTNFSSDFALDDTGGIDGEFDGSVGNETGTTSDQVGSTSTVEFKVEKFEVCDEKLREYIPCLDNEEAIRKLESTERGEVWERHCPSKENSLNCLVPVPQGYKTPIPWPQSRDEVWFSNVPHTRLVEDKGGQNWISRDNDKFKFPGGGTQFIHGADQYLDQISEMVPEIAFGKHTRVALDVGCGVASFGAYLLARDVLTLSIAPKDVHENQIQFALERNVPAMVAAFTTKRLLYPSQAFDLIHCSRCRINWTRDDGILLLEVNRMLRAGGYFAWAAQPVYKHEEPQMEAWKEMEDLTTRMCWTLVKKEGYLAIWQKPLNNSCYTTRNSSLAQPPLCDINDNPNDVWYVNLKACISRLPENGNAANVSAWPARLNEPPPRLQEVEMDSIIAKNELFRAETKYWDDIIDGYIRIFKWKKLQIRNVMDMRAEFGGFAAALINQGMDSWVMNVVPTSEPNTLPVIFDRGLIGVAHDWCEPFDTYPRTYDLLHASGLLSKEQKRCNISSILLEMDRILRPGGLAYIRDSKYIMDEIMEITKAMGWHNDLRDTAEGRYASRKILMCRKPMSRS
ncbi:hypothetical protein LUZ61_014797 [Rhynchospora tenuis]|uniref:Methyltransferase n=1 Tax=Rhynchospora tenuis TaxID=198213 RepID=A0AAD5WD85_9POAL|nr:hypothetical protein LUZ61_014797 [Rhynchospora tenuis]